MELALQLACLSRCGAEQRCDELGLPGPRKDCRARLLEHFARVPRAVLRPPARPVSVKLYKRTLWILDHLPWDSLCCAKRGTRRSIAAGNESFSLGRTSGIWGVARDTRKKSTRGPNARALLQAF